MRKILPFFLLSIAAAHSAPLQKFTVATGLHDPMSIAPSSDGDIYLVEREGKLFRIRPSTGGVFEIGNLAVSALRTTDPKSETGREDGLQGIALDPAFKTNQRLYLFYSVPDKLMDRLSRFQLRDGKLDLASELMLFEIPMERDKTVCHHGGSLQFGPDGLLYLSVGDNTNPFASDGTSPSDNRPDRTHWDAQRSAGNTNDLRGKILRIRPTETGYEIPPGNLFPEGTAKTRPEIYAMGCRNPFRMSIDMKNSTVYWGEVGPDADKPSAKGPAGHDEINQAKAAGNFGWPFLVADNKPYPVIDFTTGKQIRMTDPAAPKNTGIRNTGLTDLPPAQSAFVWYPYDNSAEFPVMGKGGRNAMAGPVFYHDSNRKLNFLTKDEDHTLITYDWMRGKILKAKLGAEEKLEKLEILDEGYRHPMDMEMAADGSIWLLEYGSDWYFNKNGKLLQLLPAGRGLETLPTAPNIEVATVAGKDRTYEVVSNNGKYDPFLVTWWLTIGATERKLGVGPSITLAPEDQGSELRAVIDTNGVPSFARISLLKEVLAPELQLQLAGKPASLAFGQVITFAVKSPTLPDAAQTTITARYIPPTGHDAGSLQFSPEIAALVTANQCLACHQVDNSSIGPSYLNVSLKYRNRSDAFDYLKTKLKSGGGGIWGKVPMPPQTALKDADADTILRSILGLSEGISQSKGLLKGTLTLAPKPANAGDGGAWEFTAEAPGFTSAKFRIPAK
jgi:cytochrome c